LSAKFRFVCATRVDRPEFHTRTALGRSLQLFRAPFIELTLYDNNKKGLAALYNAAISHAADDPAILIFVHDDVHLCDFFWPWRIAHGLRAFDIIGVAGNTRRVPGQPAWCFLDTNYTWDSAEHLSGSVAHGHGFPPTDLSHFGPSGRAVSLLDGVLLAAHSKTLLERHVYFDESFEFHFYDMDFCRRAEAQQLRMGTCTLSIIHESPGAFGSPAWLEGYRRYLDKWKS
jgi:hypothetical protein